MKLHPKLIFLKLWKRSAIKPAIHELKSFEIHNAVKIILTLKFTWSGDPLKMFRIIKTASIWNASIHPHHGTTGFYSPWISDDFRYVVKKPTSHDS